MGDAKPWSARFGPLRATPPDAVVVELTGAAAGTSWTTRRVGDAGGFPNGGLWRVVADDQVTEHPAGVVVKRTGPGHLGTSPVWSHRSSPGGPQWWGREAEFYASDLAISGWTDDVRAARCHIDDHDDCRDLWLELVHDVPADLLTCRRALSGLGQWQMAHRDAGHSWLARDWIATHVGRQGLDNDRTLAHPAWPELVERGLDPALRDLVRHRVTEPRDVATALARCPHVLTHHDFHDHNIGTVGSAVVIFDWSYVGWGPIGHDVGHLAISHSRTDSVGFARVWAEFTDAYGDGLHRAGYDGDFATVRGSMAMSTLLRMSWYIDHVLDHGAGASEAFLLHISSTFTTLVDLARHDQV